MQQTGVIRFAINPACMPFNGSNGYVSVTNIASLNLADNLAVEA